MRLRCTYGTAAPLLVMWFAMAPLARADAPVEDLTLLPLEELVALEITTASKYSQPIAQAPAAVSVITADDIRTYGYRTLFAALNSVRGLYTSGDGIYEFLGVRGFLRPGDYNGRVLVLIDGQRINDGTYDAAPIGSDFPVAMELVKRIEFVTGPGSALYGNNAFFGVVNVITLDGADLHGAQVSVDAGSESTFGGSASWGNRTDGGLDVLLSAAGFDRDGNDFYFPEYDAPSSNNGRAEGVDHQDAQRLFAKLGYGGLSLEAVHASRNKEIPNGAFGALFNDSRNQIEDTYTLFDVGYTRSLGAIDLTSNVFHYSYDYDATLLYEVPPVTPNTDRGENRAWGGELRALRNIANHTLVVGTEYRSDYRIDQTNSDPGPLYYLDDQRDKTSVGVYLQDDVQLSQTLRLNLGLRHDRFDGDESSTNPRVGLVYQASGSMTAKLLYGSAFRAPNAYELYYVTDAGNYVANTDINPEKIRTVEFVLEHAWDSRTRSTLSVYQNQIRNLIGLEQSSDPLDPNFGKFFYDNDQRATAAGVEVELDRAWRNGIHFRTSYAWQRAENDSGGDDLSNSPHHLAKLNVAIPLLGDDLTLALDGQYMSSREKVDGTHVGGYGIVNLTLSAPTLADRLALSGSVYNLFDHNASDPVSDEFAPLTRMYRDGREYFLKLTYAL